MAHENLGFAGILAVMTHGEVEPSWDALSLDGVQHVNMLVAELGKLIPEGSRILLAGGTSKPIHETVNYVGRYFNPEKTVSLESLDIPERYSKALALSVVSDLLVHNPKEYDGLIVVTTSAMSGWLSTILHVKGQSHLNLVESCAWVTQPNGDGYLSSFTGTGRTY